jgi:hypothetical protein
MRGVVDNVYVYESRLDLCATFATIYTSLDLSMIQYMFLVRGYFLVRDMVTLLGIERIHLRYQNYTYRLIGPV